MLKIGKRSLFTFIKRLFEIENYFAIIKFFKVHQKPFTAIFDEIFSLGNYPKLLYFNSPTGKAKVKIHSHHDFSTFNLIFCREDYFYRKKHKIVLDIGSNIGLSAIYWLTRNNETIVYCYEPSSENFEKFCILVDKIDKTGFDKFKNELKKNGFSNTSISELSKILSYEGDNKKKIEFLSKFLKSSKTGTDGINQIRDLIRLNNKFKIDFSLARGLSYYTSTIFEVIPTKENIGSLCGGGRYDDLTEIFGYKDISGIGISFGIERIIEIMNLKKLFPNNILSSNNILISYLSNEYISKSLEIAKLFRKNNIKVDLYSDNGKLKKQLQYANNNNIPYVVIVGEEEIRSNLFTLKNMKDGSQKKLSIENILSKISS